jgi:PAS domain S-box-containing protein
MRLHAKFLVLILGGLVLFAGVLSFQRVTRELLVSLIALLAPIAVVLYLAVRRMIMRPLTTLCEGAGRLGRGDLTRRISLSTGDELEDLAQSFNVMAGRLEECHARLEDNGRELVRHTNLLHGILSGMSSGIILLGENGVVSLVNDMGAKILRSRREDLLNRELTELVPEASSFLQSGAVPYREIEIRLNDGTTVPVGFSSAYYHGASGGREGIIVSYRDLTELRELQAALLNREGFAAMGQVVAGVAHEIRNPLFGISSVGQILERELVCPEHQELVRALLAETKRMNQLVEELLLYGHPMKLTLERCDLAKIWEEVIGLHREELDRKGIRISRDSRFVAVNAMLDSGQIRQVFMNLLRNAIEATQPGGEITVRLLLEDRYQVVKIADTGIGIRPQNLGKIFDLFFTTKPKGTGLGLAICKKIVHDHGGHIMIESEEGKGTAVTVKLPYRASTENIS